MTIQENASLKELNTFGIPAKARYLAHITSTEALDVLTKNPLFSSVKHLILGGGSNILFTKDYDGLIIKVDINGKTILEETESDVLISVGAGENWHQFVLYCISHGWGGLENLSLIPGSVGAAPIQNIGAYGVEIEKSVEYVEGIDLTTGESRRLTHPECRFGYRESVFKHDLHEKFFISSVTLRLTKKNHRLDIHYGAIKEVLERNKIAHPGIKEISDAVIDIRRSKLPDPSVIGNAGSFFKNPTVNAEFARVLQQGHPSMPVYPVDNQYVKIPAGWLIEQCGWKGKKSGRVGVHERQALVLVNFGDGNGEEILQLATEIQDSVMKKFGVTLMTEVNII